MIGSSGSGVVRTISVGSSGPDPVDPGVSVDFVDIDFVSDFVPNITEKTTKKKKPLLTQLSNKNNFTLFILSNGKTISDFVCKQIFNFFPKIFD